eukprot:Gb_09794 [translate_table: standard]
MKKLHNFALSSVLRFQTVLINTHAFKDERFKSCNQMHLFLKHVFNIRAIRLTISAVAIAPSRGSTEKIYVEPEGKYDYCVDVRALCKEGRFWEALEMFDLMDQRGVRVDSGTYTCLLQGCISLKAYEEGKRIHAHMTGSGCKPDLFQRNCLINMYIKCGSLVCARQVFDEMPERNVVSWSATISGYVQHGYAIEALELFRQMQWANINPTQFTLGSVLRACASLGALEHGKQVHARIVKIEVESQDVVSNVLVDMYAKCGSILNARQVFDKMPQRNSISWNAMISVYCQHDYGENALRLFHQMQRCGVKPTQFTFGSVITACASLLAMEEGKQVNVHIIKTGYTSDLFVGSALVNMYFKCGCPGDARLVFDRMPERNVVSWTAMMVGYVQHKRGEDAIRVYEQMRLAGVYLNHNSFAIALSACSSLEAQEKGTQIHTHTIKTGFESDVSVGNGLVTMYAKCRNIEDACKVFDQMPTLDLISWNAIISGYAQNGHNEEALNFFCQMQQAGLKSSSVALASALSSCASLESLEHGKQLHSHVFKAGLELDISVGNALISMYARSARIRCSREVFDKMAEQDLISWNAMIGGYAQNELSEEAMELFHQMRKTDMCMNHITFVSILGALTCPEAIEHGKQVHAHMINSGFEPDVCVENALLTMYAKCGRMEDASKLFHKMLKKDAVSWNAMIAGYALNGHGEEALEIICKMQEAGMKLDHFTFATILRACASIAALEHGKQIHASIIRGRLESDIFVGSALVDMYSKCGSIEDARHVFDKMADRNDVSWNAMISGYARHGHGEDALQLFCQMQQAGMKPDRITFVSVLCACSHVGLLDEGCNYFDSMSQIYGITPRVEHYACIVDLLGRAGCLSEAEDFINKMPVQANALVWRTLLGACRVHGNMEIGKRAAECLLELEPQDAATYVLLSNIYASAGKWNDVTKVRTMMKDRGVKKDPGCSWIKLKDGVHAFFVGDRSHPQTKEIYAMLANLTEQMKELGYVPDTNFVLHDVEQEQKEHFLCCHSEKLAISFGLINTPSGMPIRIIKNLRVCGDCHSAIKFISRIVGRKIVVRDSNRYHHFKDGLCSCGDYW